MRSLCEKAVLSTVKSLIFNAATAVKVAFSHRLSASYTTRRRALAVIMPQSQLTLYRSRAVTSNEAAAKWARQAEAPKIRR